MACRMEYTWNGAGTLSGAGLRAGIRRVPNSSSVLFFGVAVNATKVMPASSARRHLRGQDVFGAHLAAVPQFGELLGRQHGLELRSRPRRSASCAPRRRSRRSACPAWPTVRAPLRGRRERSGWCRRRSSCRPTSASASSALLLPSPLITSTVPSRALWKSNSAS
jgi:hypothetical protein